MIWAAIFLNLLFLDALCIISSVFIRFIVKKIGNSEQVEALAAETVRI